MKSRIVSRTVWFCVLAVMAYTAYIIWTDASKNLAVLRAFSWSSLPLIIGLVLVNFLLRELKWDFFRRAAHIKVPRLGSFLVFFSGYSMAISPGRVGELIKPFMYKEYFNKKMRRSIPLVFCERVTDLLGMIVIALVSVVPFMTAIGSNGRGAGSSHTATLIYVLLGLSVVIMAAGIWFARSKRLVYGLIRRGMRLERLRPSLKHLQHLYFATYPLLTVRNLVIATALGAVSWSFECVALKVILNGVGASHVTVLQLAFVFCMATIVGGFFFFLPGGLGGFEVAALSLLGLLGVSEYARGPAVLIVRFCTLFFAVGMGFLFILLTALKYNKPLQWDEFAQVGDEPLEAAELQ